MVGKYCATGSHSDDECHHRKRYGKRKESSTADSNSKKYENFIADSNMIGCGLFLCFNSKAEINIWITITNCIRHLGLD